MRAYEFDKRRQQELRAYELQCTSPPDEREGTHLLLTYTARLVVRSLRRESAAATGVTIRVRVYEVKWTR
jgi:hypothetical protein